MVTPALRVQLVLPDVYDNSVVINDFVGGGLTYVIANDNASITSNPNEQTLIFGLQLVDWANMVPVTLKCIQSLEISNDPLFDVPSTLTITNWPCASTDVNTADWYNPLHSYYAVPTSSAGEMPSSFSYTTTPPDGMSAPTTPGLFYVLGWPLSGNGGLSTVYVRLTVADTSGDTGTYPGGYGGFGQVLWEAEPPSRPGVPIASNAWQGSSLSWIGRRNMFEFRTSEESGTGMFGSGVARYLGDAINIRPVDSNVPTTRSTNISASTYRSVLPGIPLADGSLMTLSPYTTAPAYTDAVPPVQLPDTFAPPSSGFTIGTACPITTTAGVAVYGQTLLNAPFAADSFTGDDAALALPWQSCTAAGSSYADVMHKNGAGKVYDFTQTSGHYACYYSNTAPPCANYSVSATLHVVGTTGVVTGVIGRYDPVSGNHYRMYVSGGNLCLDLVNGAVVSLGTCPYSPVNGDVISLNLCGGVLSASVNNVEKLSEVDFTIRSAGYAGLFTNTTSTGILLGAFAVTSSGVVLNSVAPDIVAQANIAVTTNSTSAQHISSLRIYRQPTPTVPSSYGDELGVQVSFVENGICQATLFQWVGNNRIATQPVMLPSAIIPDMLSGGTLELIVSTYSAYPLLVNYDLVVAAYFTPNTPNGADRSYLLGNAVFTSAADGWTSWDYNTYGVAFSAYMMSGTGAITLNELFIAQARAMLCADLGDCQTDEQVAAIPPSSQTISGNWAAASQAGDWLVFTEPIVAPVGVSVDFSSGNASLGAVAANPGGRAVAEIEAANPTCSDCVLISWTLAHTFGEFYVALSPVSVATPLVGPQVRTMAGRCDDTTGDIIDPSEKPTLLVSFNKGSRDISILQRTAQRLSETAVSGTVSVPQSDNRLTKRTWLPYIPGTTDTWSLEIRTSSGPNKADGTFLTLRRNASGDFLGETCLEQALPSSVAGLGWYVSFGVRSDRDSSYTEQYTLTPNPGLATVTSFSVSPLPHQSVSAFAPSVRHFQQATAGASDVKPWLGQFLLSGMTDRADVDFATPISMSSAGFGVVDFASSISIDVSASLSSGTTILDGATVILATPTSSSTTKTSYSVLLYNQQDPATNGIWRLAFNSASTTWLWSRDARLPGFDPNIGVVGPTTLSPPPASSLSAASLYKWVQVVSSVSQKGVLNEGTYWYLDAIPPTGINQNPANGALGPIVFTPSIYTQRLDNWNWEWNVSSNAAHPQIFECRMFCTDTSVSAPIPAVRFYSDTDGSIEAPVTGWINAMGLAGGTEIVSPIITSGELVPRTETVQFDLSRDGGLIIAHQTAPIWVAISVPPSCRLASANSLNLNKNVQTSVLGAP